MFAFPLMPPLLVNRVIFAQVPCSSAKERAKVKVHFEGGGPVNPAKKTSQQQSVRGRGSVMLAACLQRYQEVIRGS